MINNQQKWCSESIWETYRVCIEVSLYYTILCHRSVLRSVWTESKYRTVYATPLSMRIARTNQTRKRERERRRRREMIYLLGLSLSASSLPQGYDCRCEWWCLWWRRCLLSPGRCTPTYTVCALWPGSRWKGCLVSASQSVIGNTRGSAWFSLDESTRAIFFIENAKKIRKEFRMVLFDHVIPSVKICIREKRLCGGWKDSRVFPGWD